MTELQLTPEMYQPKLQHHLEQLRKISEHGEKTAEFIEWFTEQIETEKGVITNATETMQKLEQQNHLEEGKAAAVAMILLAGSEWERTDPSPENREDTPTLKQVRNNQ